MAETINEGEAADLRERMRVMERWRASFESDMRVTVSVHEARCAFRYGMLLVGLAVSIAINIPAAWPHLMMLIGLAR